MKIHVLGVRGEIKPSAPYHSHHSGTLIDDFLFDLGEKEFLDYKPSQIFITHLHPDHAYFVLDKKGPDTDIPVHAPEQFDDAHLNVFTSPHKFGSYLITPIPTIHSIRLKSQAYRIDKDDQHVLYTGDMIWIDKRYHHLLKGLDLVITEGSFMRKGGGVRRNKETGQIFGHNGIPDLVHLFKQFTQRILLVHFGSWFYDDIDESHRKIQELAKENGIEITAGYEGLKMSVK